MGSIGEETLRVPLCTTTLTCVGCRTSIWVGFGRFEKVLVGLSSTGHLGTRSFLYGRQNSRVQNPTKQYVVITSFLLDYVMD